VVSYLAVPVVSRSGEVHGGLFFGHERPGVFTRDSEDIVAAIAAHAAIALDNARLLQSAQTAATHRRRADEAAQRLAAIVESSDDAIISKTLDGVITTWNRGAQRLFGYTSEEAIGNSILMLIPPERRDEEDAILGRIRRGEPTDHFETVRQRKDGTFIDVSLTISPVRDADGRIVGASKIARDITDRRRAEQQQELLVREMSHRIKNLFAVTNSVVALSARSARTPQEMAHAVQGRLSALTRAHDLTRPGVVEAQRRFGQHTSLQAIIRTILSPYVEAARAVQHDRVVISGSDVPVGTTAITSLALILHEFATNAAKYGALSTSTGCVAIDCAVAGDDVVMTWQERGGPPLDGPPESEGFGGQLARRMVTGQFDGDASWDWQPDGVVIRLSMPIARLAL
ncbi:MAG TPA: PAS domain S-box protein, partial [Vineibacter sp.]|nr:PAS domain S-box protein [Vineibacter sp.]